MADGEALSDALYGHVQALSVHIGERTPLNPGRLARARDYIRGQLQGFGLEVSEQPYEFHGQGVANIVARPPQAPESATYYLLGAHYDTVPGTPGADDNASAVAVLLEVARRVAKAPPPVPLRLAAFTLEEPPAFNTTKQGSRVFVKRAKQAGETISGAIVLEMVGYTAPEQDYPLVLTWAGYPKSGDYIGVVSNWGSRRFAKTVIEGLRASGRLPIESLFVPLNGWVLPDTRLSDHASFWDSRFPAVMVTDTAFFRNPNYHSASDRIETLDFAFMAELVNGLEAVLEALPASG